MVFHNAFANGKADAGAGVFCPGVEPLENDENALKVFGLDADPIVLDGKYPLGAILANPDVDAWGGFSVEFNPVADQVLEERWVSWAGLQWSVGRGSCVTSA